MSESNLKIRLLGKTKSASLGFDTPCWIWQGEQDKYGYGRIKSNGKYMPVHWVLKGVPPGDLEVDHLCKQRSCVRPAHLEYVTRQENLRRRDEDYRKRNHGS